MNCPWCADLMALDESESYWYCDDCSEHIDTPEYKAEYEYQRALYEGAKLAGLIREDYDR